MYLESFGVLGVVFERLELKSLRSKKNKSNLGRIWKEENVIFVNIGVNKFIGHFKFKWKNWVIVKR